MIHELKSIYPYFDDVWEGRKQFEIRFRTDDEAGITPGQILRLHEYNPYKIEGHKYSGRIIEAVASYVLRLTDVPSFPVNPRGNWFAIQLEHVQCLIDEES